MVAVGRLVGRLILVVLDACVAGAVAGFVAFLAVPLLYVDDRVVLAGTTAGLTIGVTLAVALGLAGLGRRPFPATRLAKGALDRFPLWWPP